MCAELFSNYSAKGWPRGWGHCREFLMVNAGESMFKNGAGNLLFYELLTLVPQRCRVAISTTNNPNHGVAFRPH